MVSVNAEKQANATGSAVDGIKSSEAAPKSWIQRNGFLRVFAYGSPSDYTLECMGILAAIGSGTALAMVNLVIGDFISLLSSVTTSNGPPEDFMHKVSNYALYFVYIGIARLVCTYVYSTIFTYVALRLTCNLRHAYLRAALSQEISYFDHGSGGSISMQATSNGKLIQDGIDEKLGQIFQAVATFVAAFVLAFVSQWKLTLITICILPALLIIVWTAAAIDAGLEAKILNVYAQAGAFAEGVLGSTRTTHAFDLRHRMVARYSKYLRNARNLGKKKNYLYGFMFAGEYFAMFAGMGLAFWQGIAMIARGEVGSIGTVFTVIFSVIIAAGTINMIAPHSVVFSRAATSASELFPLIDRESDIDPFNRTGKTPSVVQGDIRLQSVTFSYPTRPHVRALEDFSLHVPAGKVTALVEPVLFNCTVFENIAYGLVGTEWESASEDQRMERVKSAAKLAFAHEFIENLPQGYGTCIGERGGLLSGGQKQRVAIARSIISDPRILLLDEATSALDPHAEGIVQRALDEASKDRTTIVIAHNLKTIRHADNIVVMKNGKIVEQGRHEELVARQSAYAALVKAQDLSPQEVTKDLSDTSDDEQHTLLGPKLSLGNSHQPIGDHRLPALKDREDYSLTPQTGLVRTVTRLVAVTPELWSWYGIAAAVCIIGAGVYPGQALLLGNVLDVFGAEDMQERGNFISLMFFVMALGLLGVYWCLGWTTNVIAQAISQQVRRDLFSGFLRQDLRFFDRPENTVGSLTSRIDSHANAIMDLMGFNIVVILISIVTVMICSVLSIIYSWKLGLVGVFAGLPPMVIAGYIRIRVETKMNANIDKKFSSSASVASEMVTAIRTVSSLAIEETVLWKYVAELDNAIDGSKPSLVLMMIWFSFTQAVEYFILALGFWWGSKLVLYNEITFYQFVVSFMAVYFSGQGGAQMFSFASSFTKANSAANYYFWLRRLEPTIQETAENQYKGPKNCCSLYNFQNIGFSYPLAPNTRVLKGISLKIEPGQFVAFVGASGCGKSTMISLLERFYDPNTGVIVIDGSDSLTEINPRLYRRHVSLVQQEPTLFPGSILENIAMGIDCGAEGEERGQAYVDSGVIEAACRAANAWDFISSLPEGLDTLCGTSGSQLSGGQRQRIAIARALVRNPNVILLDEATSALDTESERIVQAALANAAATGNRITVAVAHRLSTVRDADRIFVFYGGRVLEAGTHGELIAQGGTYKKMCEAQSLDTAL
ncbi:hypothetical protein DL771_004517 [Monosporascus sp. 5C6A]|nr:hypothetical protein DL771_004517 [Monosporascus sp. 5C6A]